MELFNPSDIIALFCRQERTAMIAERIKEAANPRIWLKGLTGSSASCVAASVFKTLPFVHLHILSDKESAAYFLNDLENIFEEQEAPFDKKRLLFFPASYKKHYDHENIDNANVLLRTEVINKLANLKQATIIVTYPEALSEKIVSKHYLSGNTITLARNENRNIDKLIDMLLDAGFERVEFVGEPGQFTLRGGIIDVFSFANDYPYRIEFTGDTIDSVRTFDPVSQLSVNRLSEVAIVPDFQKRIIHGNKDSFFSLLPDNAVLWIEDINDSADFIDRHFDLLNQAAQNQTTDNEHFIDGKAFLRNILNFRIIETGRKSYFQSGEDDAHNFSSESKAGKPITIEYQIKPQPSFNKKFDLFISDLNRNTENNFINIILSDTAKQTERIYSIINDITASRKQTSNAADTKKDNQQQRTDSNIPSANLPDFKVINLSLHEGFIDNELKIAFYTDHQLFERYHRYRLNDSFSGKEALSVKELYGLNPGDFVTHIDHGIGRFAGLEKIDVKGKKQEAIRLVYKDGDILYISIHSLHRISKYIGKDGTEPALNRLGSNAWNNLKNKTKQKIKDIAKDLIKLYASRKASKGFAFSPDSYLQTELEASFIYEDTPDQIRTTADVKKDMEAGFPMDRLICGDVGFGKTEIAVRAAFKAVADSRQVALLVPTTILALQHYNTFRERLRDLPCNVEYISRFRSAATINKILKETNEGRVDILIGTHKLLGKEVKFKNLGLLIIDEEQKFGVAAKEKLKQMRVNVDTLTLTATPIPRTLQFSLMGARDLSVINTAPPNRFPIQTELHAFSEQIIRDAILFEVSRGGQVFFVHNRVQNITEIAGIVQRLCPDIKIAVGHGQMKGHQLEKVMLDFIEGGYDVLIATTIIENGLDIPNANTIIINEAQHYGLSDLHQLRGRVGRSNRKAFCYLLAPPVSVLTDDARKRLKAIEEFTDLGSGFNIAMRDLDIRGAGNILGAEQSGFISDIGYEMYQKILNEAIDELKETEYRELYVSEIETDKRTASNEQRTFVRDCIIETDLSIMIPDDYVSNITERLNLYKELDNTETEGQLEEFEKMLNDRFGSVPPETSELINAIRLRWLAKSTGFEKIILRNDRLVGYFISNQDSPYYQSEKFTGVLEFVKKNPKSCSFKQINKKLFLSLPDVRSVNDALKALSAI